MITIKKAPHTYTKPWSKKEWHKLDKPHYGHHVEWNEKKFRFVAEENGKIVGVITGKHESGMLYISSIITGEKARGKGIGTMLINKAEKFGRKIGAHAMWLMTGSDWSENLFYKKLGFKLTARLPNFHFHKDFVIYTRPIK